MATFDFNGKQIYFEEYGQGRPLVILNGIMMSCASWKEFIDPLSECNRLLLLDLLDQGKSARMDGPYEQAVQAEVVLALLDHLGIGRACLVGISYGGEVAQRFAIDHPDRVDRLVLFNTTPRTGPWLGDIGEGWNLAARDPESYYYATIPVIYSPRFYLRKHDWMTRRHQALHTVFANQDFIQAMIRLTDSARNYDVTEDLHKIAAPTLVVSCREDYLTPMAEQELICSRIPNSKHVILPGSGHASMYEQPLLFAALTLGFCNTSKTEYHIT